MAALAGFRASVYITSTPSLAFTNEAFTDAGDHKTYTITNAAKRYWDNTQALTVQTAPDGVTWTTVTTGFTVNYCGGVVTFTNAVAGATPSVRVSGSYFPYSLFGDAKSVDLTTTLDILDVTTFSSGGWKQKLASLVTAQYKLSRWWVDHFFVNALTNKTRLVISVYTGANANQRYDAFAYLKGDGIKFDVKSAHEESLDFEVDGQLNAILS